MPSLLTAGRNEGNLDDLALSFDVLGIRLPELEEYLSNVELPRFAPKVCVGLCE